MCKDKIQKRAINILLLADTPYVGGTNAYILNLYNGLQQYDDLQVHLAVLEGRRTDIWLIEQLRTRNIPHDIIPVKWSFDLYALKHLYAFLKKRRIQLIHTNGYRSNVMVRLLVKALRLRIPVITTMHGLPPKEGLKWRLYFWLERWTSRWSKCLIAVSEDTKQRLIRNNYPNRNIEVIYNALQPDLLPNGSSSERYLKEFNLSPENPVIAYIGRVTKNKGLEELLNVTTLLVKDFPKLRLLIVGGGELLPELKNKVNQLKLKENVLFTGIRKDVLNILTIVDVVVLLSKEEGLPMSLIEASAMGVPVIATKVGGIPEVVINGQTGILLDHVDTNSIYQALKHLLSNPVERRRLAENARTLAQKKFVGNMPEKVRALYLKTVKN